MMSHQMPTDAEIRRRIEAIPDEKYRMAFKFQYLAAARISEVCGKYAPKGEDAIATDFDGALGVLFIVKTAKRKGRLRPVAIPLSVEYEPWADEVRQFFATREGEYPFKFADKWSTSIRYMQWQAEEAFKDLEWPMVGYTVKRGDANVKIPARWKGVTSHVMRKRRAVTLLFDYDFDHVDLAIYGGWTIASSAEGVPQALKNYLYLEPGSSSEPLKLLKKMARRYFKKLCIVV